MRQAEESQAVADYKVTKTITEVRSALVYGEQTPEAAIAAAVEQRRMGIVGVVTVAYSAQMLDHGEER